MASKYTVTGGLAGYDNRDADETTLTGRFKESFADRAAAVARGREVAALLQPGGCVAVVDETESQGVIMGVPETLGQVSRRLTGEWVVDCGAVELLNPNQVEA